MLGWQEEALGGWEQERSIECIRSEERVLLDIPIGNFPFWSYRIRRTQKPRRQNVNVESAPFQKYQTEDPLKTPKIDTTSPDLAVIKASRFLSTSDIVEERHHPPLAEWISRPHIKQHQYYISIHNNCVAEKRCKEVLFRRYVYQLVQFSFTSFMVLCKPSSPFETSPASPPWISGMSPTF